jgi:GTP-binding protein
MMKKLISKVAIIGRANVGKSTLFNRLSVDVKSLIFDYAGVTRDTIHDIVSWKGICFELIDTGGIQTKNEGNDLAKVVSDRARNIMNNADLVLFMCDAEVGVLAQDRTIAKELYKIGKPVILMINKYDSRMAQHHEHEFVQLGFKTTLFISALQGTGIGELLDAIVNVLPQGGVVDEQEAVREKADYRIVLFGKPNVGKSSLLNLILKEECAIVADMPGTTREAVGQNVSFYNEDLLVTDTPGIRKKRKIDEPLEAMMIKTAFRALERADIVVLLTDASTAQLSDQELKLAFYAFEHGKGLLILFNKHDLTDENTQKMLDFNLEPYDHLISKVHTLSISCKTGKNVGRVLPLLKKIWEKHKQEFSGQELTTLFKEALMHRPHFHKGQALQLIYAKQLKYAPITILLRVNNPDWFGDSQKTFLENAMRKKYSLQGVPVRFIVARDT